MQRRNFSVFPVLPGCVEILVRLGGEIKQLLVANFISNISAENYQYSFMNIILWQVNPVFFLSLIHI